MALARASYGGGGYQTDVSGMSAGYGGGAGNPDMSMMMELAKRRAAQQLEAGRLQNVALKKAVNAPAPREMASTLQMRNAAAGGNPSAPYGQNSAYGQGMKFRSAMAQLPEQTAAQRAVSATGGVTGRAYSDSMRQMMGQTMAGIPNTNYTGFTDLVQALSGSSAAAENAAGRGREQQADLTGNPSISEAARAGMIARQYPGLARRMAGG